MTKKSGQKGGWMKTAKELNDFLKEAGYESVDELKAALEHINDAPKVAVAPRPVAVVPDPKPDAEVEDCLKWVTAEHGAVHVVARFQNLVLRPGKDGYNPPLSGVQVHEYTRGPWAACPFDLRSRSREQEVLNHARYGRWAHIAITKDAAEMAYADPRWPLPEKAVIVPSEYGGWDPHGQQCRGTFRPLKERIALRESLRRCLQRFPGQVFINAQYHPEMGDIRIANPYGNRLAGLVLRLPAVKHEGATA